MRAALLSAALALGLAQTVLATPALAAPAVAEVKVSIGPDLAKKAETIGTREFDLLTTDLKRSIERKLSPRPGGGTLALVIEDAKPNRPTAQQMSRTPGLSMESFGVGGARISGVYVAPGGARTPIDYSWYESDIRQARYGATWSDAETAFDKLAVRLSKDQFGPR
jgi:hypothetical protein